MTTLPEEHVRRLLFAALVLTPLAWVSGASATPSTRTVSSVAYGVRISLTVPNHTYIREHFIDAPVRVKNVSRRTIHLYGYPATCWWNGYGGQNPLVVVRSGSGSIVFPPRSRVKASCPRPRLFPLPPGVTRRSLLYVPARGRWLQASVRIVVRGTHRTRVATISSPRIKIELK